MSGASGGLGTDCCPRGPHRRATVAGLGLVGGTVGSSLDARPNYQKPKAVFKLDRDEASHSNCVRSVCARREFKLGRSMRDVRRTAPVTAPFLFWLVPGAVVGVIVVEDQILMSSSAASKADRPAPRFHYPLHRRRDRRVAQSGGNAVTMPWARRVNEATLVHHASRRRGPRSC
jgi:hypothetical protein